MPPFRVLMFISFRMHGISKPFMIFERYLRIPLPANGTFEDIKLGITKSQGGIRHLRERVYFNYRAFDYPCPVL